MAGDRRRAAFQVLCLVDEENKDKVYGNRNKSGRKKVKGARVGGNFLWWW